ncbi:MAG: ATP-binding protein, partial [Campylobacterota bacterium]|nr:ATP-binding protein [Campylobacterota bacterium]
LYDEIVDVKKLNDFRKIVDNFSAVPFQNMHFYINIIDKLINNISNIALISNDFKLSQLLSSYISIIKAKEFAGVKRALFSYAFSAREFTAKDFSTFNTYLTLYKSHIENFKSMTLLEINLKLEEIMKSDSYKEVDEFQKYIANKMIKNEILSKIKAVSGYGGLIHNFKNYVLRDNEKYYNKFKLDYQKLSTLIEKYKQLKCSDEELKLLNMVALTFHGYRDDIEMLHNLKTRPTISTLDKLVIRDDAPAIEAIKKLSSSVVGIRADKWFEIATIWINELYSVENKLADNLLENIRETKEDLDTTLNNIQFFIIMLLFVVLFLSMVIIKDILQKLKILEGGLISFLDYLTGRKEKFKLLEVSGVDELSSMAKVLNESMNLNANYIAQEVVKRTNQIESANRAKSDFLANMSHEIRTPLNGIMGFIDILYKNETDTKKQDKLNIIKESADTLLTIINDILDFSKIEQNKLLIEKLPFNIQDPFTLIVELFFGKAKDRDINISLFIDEKLPQKTLGDITRTKQVFSNLLSNAIKFAHNDSVVVVNINYLKDTHELYCEVVDEGIGIEPTKLETIFNSFEQEDSSTTRKFGGTGLGLSISKALVELMGGKIGVKSELGVGSTFYFTIPLFEALCEVTQVNKQDVKDIAVSGKVLVVEDNKTNQMLLTMLLDDLDLDVEVVDDGSEAVEAVKNNRYDLILMDENMPIMNGTEATRIIRTLDIAKDIPIIAVTANALKGDRERFLENGMDDYLSKPIDVDELEIMIKKYLRGV